MNYFPLILGLLPAFAWLIFYLKEDPRPEPKSLIIEIFLAGAVSTFIVFSVQTFFNNWAEPRGISQYSLISLLVLAGIEEIFKFSAARLVVGKHPRDFDEPVDAMIYLIVAALGFAAVENVAAAMKAKELAMETTTLRFIGATLLHTLSSGLIGYYWALSIIKKKAKILFTGFALAILLHTVFNYLILSYEPVIVPTVFLMVAALFILYDFEKLKHFK